RSFLRLRNSYSCRFPTCRISFSGIDPIKRYLVLMDIVPVDNKRYRYAYHRSSWLVAGKADPPSPNRLCIHPDAPYSGDQLRKQVVSFEKVKLTNNEMDKQGHVSIPSPPPPPSLHLLHLPFPLHFPQSFPSISFHAYSLVYRSNFS